MKGASRGGSALGLDSIRFDTLGLAREPDEEPDSRYWLGQNLLLSENWFSIPPDFPSLDERKIRTMYEAALGAQPGSQDLAPRLLHLAVRRETPVPVVQTLIRIIGPGDNRYGFVGAVTLPLAECSWVVKVESYEVGMTGVRETVAFHRFSEERPDLSFEERTSLFDPYDARWDSDQNDPLTLVRKSTDRVLASLDVDPEVRQATQFR
jgi:hypothetical protein